MSGGASPAPMGWRRRSWVRWSLWLLLVIAAALALNAYRTRDAVDGAAPPFQAQSVAGDSLSLDQFAGRPLVVHFWATWCPVCRLEQDAIEALVADEYQVVTVAIQSGGEDAIRAYLHEHQLSFPVIDDAHGALARRFGVTGVPTSFVLDGRGRVRFVEMGFTTSWGLRLRAWWASR